MDSAAPLREPLRLNDETVRALLRAEGWPYEKLTDHLWRSHFALGDGEGTLPLLVRFDADAAMVRFAVAPIAKSPEEPAAAARLYQALLTLNREMRLAKFAIDDDLDVLLTAEYPVAALDRSEFVDGLEVIAHYARTHRARVRDLVKY